VSEGVDLIWQQMYNIHIFPYRAGAVPSMRFADRYRLYIVYLVFSVVSICVLIQCTQAKGAKGDPLWQKAVAIAEANKGWIPGFGVLRIEILNKQGKLERQEETLLDFSKEDAGEGSVEPYVDPSSLNIVGNSPFEPEFQNEVSAHFAGEIRDIQGRQCYRYEYVWHREEEVLAGTAWLQQDTGIPVKTESSRRESVRSKFPSRQCVKVMFHNESYDVWFPQKMIMEIEAGLLSLGRSLRITLEYRDYRRTE
jgi:hypothetical protein